MATIRQQRVSELLFEELSIMIGNELTDPRLLLVRVTSVVVSRDLRNVKVYVSHDNDEVTKEQVLKGLRHATPFLRRQIAARATLRAVPELLFYYDDTPERAARVESLLRQISAQRTDNDPTSAGENVVNEDTTPASVLGIDVDAEDADMSDESESEFEESDSGSSNYDESDFDESAFDELDDDESGDDNKPERGSGNRTHNGTSSLA